MNVESFRLKDPLEWTVGEVGDFLASILQGDLGTTWYNGTTDLGTTVHPITCYGYVMWMTTTY